jgi:hypothetical protein
MPEVNKHLEGIPHFSPEDANNSLEQNEETQRQYGFQSAWFTCLSKQPENKH